MVSRRVYFNLGMLFLSGLTANGAISPTSVETAKVDDHVYFRVELPLPSDNQDMSGHFRDAGPAGSTPRFATLSSSPVYDVPCYMRVVQNDAWGPTESSNVFYGKTKLKDPIKLKLTYPKSAGAWGNEDVNVTFDSATPMTTRTATLARGTTTTELSPAQQFAHAQAGYFELMSYQIPDDAGFFNYARLQTLRAAKLDHFERGDDANRDALNWGNNRDRLYETATGARAIQETLQMDRMLSNQNAMEPREIDISSVEAVQTKSHPWAEMLKGKTPKFSEIARMVPEDQYMLHFTSVAKLQELADKAQNWGASLLKAPEIGGAEAGLREKLQKQICLPSTVLTQLLGPSVVKELAITGSDPYFRAGTDITVIFETVSPDLFNAAVDQYWKSALAEHPDADTNTSTVAGLVVEKIVTFHREVSAYRVVVGNTVIYSNSPVGLARVLETKAKPESSLASALDYQYMRSVWPQDSAKEDGFLYLSDSFIRRLVGPHSKIKAKRRLEAYGGMRMVLNAAMLNGYLRGPGAVPNMAQLQERNLIEPADIREGEGKVVWNHEAATVHNEVFGTPNFLTPICELPIEKISKSEQEEYTTFRDRYQSYWRRYFDPIGVRIKVEKTLSMEAYILPLIDESAYNDLKNWTGDTPAKMDLAQISTSTLVRWQVRLDPEARQIRDGRQMVGSMFGQNSSLFDWLGNWAAVWMEDSPISAHIFADVFDVDARDDNAATPQSSRSLTSFFELPIAAGIDVKNRLSLAAFLVALQGMAASAAPDLVQFVPQEPYKGTTVVKVSPKPGGTIDRELNREAQSSAGDSPTTTPEVGLYYGTVGDAWYISTKQAVLKNLIDTVTAASAQPREIEYSAVLLASPGNVVHARPAIEKGTAVIARNRERTSLWQAWMLYRCGLTAPNDSITSAAQTWFGGEIRLPSGGTISYDPATDQAVSSVYGPMCSMKSIDEAKAANPLLRLFDSINNVRAWLRFTEDGLMTHVELEQK